MLLPSMKARSSHRESVTCACKTYPGSLAISKPMPPDGREINSRIIKYCLSWFSSKMIAAYWIRIIFCSGVTIFDVDSLFALHSRIAPFFALEIGTRVCALVAIYPIYGHFSVPGSPYTTAGTQLRSESHPISISDPACIRLRRHNRHRLRSNECNLCNSSLLLAYQSSSRGSYVSQAGLSALFDFAIPNPKQEYPTGSDSHPCVYGLQCEHELQVRFGSYSHAPYLSQLAIARPPLCSHT